MGKGIDLTGKRFGRLVAMKIVRLSQRDGYIWKCKCDCGGFTEVYAHHLTRGSTHSCGCMRSQNGKKVSKYGSRHHEVFNWKEGTALQLLGNKPRKDNTSGTRGVSWSSKYKKYEVYITFQCKKHSLGYFDNLKDATRVRKEAEEKYFTPILEKYGRLKDDRDGA